MPVITLVRHAQASFGAANYDALSELGHRQAQWLGEHFRERGVRFAVCASGSLQRQTQTLDAIAGALPYDPPRQCFDGLNEYLGDAILDADLRARNEMRDAAPTQKTYFRRLRTALLAWTEGSLDADVPETWAQFGGRAWEALERICAPLERDDHALVVSSGGVISRLVADTLQATPAMAIEINLQTRNASVTQLILSSSRRLLVSYNAVPHLERPGRDEFITYA